MALLIDISRLVENLHLQTPTGIDRVEMAYALHFLQRADRDDVRFVVTWPAFSGILDVAYVKPLIEDVAARWRSGPHDLDRDRTLQALRHALNQPSSSTSADAPIQVGESDQDKTLAQHLATASTLLRSALRPLTGSAAAKIRRQGGWYIQVSQFRLNRPMRFTWMRAANVRGLFMLHDLIPILHPEYCRPGEAERHGSRVDTMIDRGAVIVANSEYTRRSLLTHFGGRSLPRCEVVPLGISPIFAAATNVLPLQSRTPYFVVIGTIEPRKNLEFLLTLWRRWTEDGNASRARLVVVGRRGWEIENVMGLLDRSVGLAPTVIEARSVSDAGMVALLRGATALIAPSWAEGFGLPIAEALALGTPVLASDIEAHREVGGAFAEYIGPIDGCGWLEALDAYSAPDSEHRRARVAALNSYRAPTWSDHMARVEELIS